MNRFAAKEAAIKAHPHRRLTFHDIIITRNSVARHPQGPEDGNIQQASGAPVAVIRGGEEGTHDQEALISISHDGDYATAVCLGFNPCSWEPKG